MGLFELVCLLIVSILAYVVFVALRGVYPVDNPFAMGLFLLSCLMAIWVIAVPLYLAVRTILGNRFYILDRDADSILQNGKRIGLLSDLKRVEIREFLSGKYDGGYYAVRLVFKGGKQITVDYSYHWVEIDRIARAIYSYASLGSSGVRLTEVPLTKWTFPWPDQG